MAKNQEFGFSIIEVLVSLALMMGVVIAVAKFSTKLEQGEKEIEDRVDLASFQDIVMGQVSANLDTNIKANCSIGDVKKIFPISRLEASPQKYLKPWKPSIKSSSFERCKNVRMDQSNGQYYFCFEVSPGKNKVSQALSSENAMHRGVDAQATKEAGQTNSENRSGRVGKSNHQ